MILRNEGNGWYRLEGHPTYYAFIRYHSQGSWGYGVRNTANAKTDFPRGWPEGSELFAKSKALAIEYAKRSIQELVAEDLTEDLKDS